MKYNIIILVIKTGERLFCVVFIKLSILTKEN